MKGMARQKIIYLIFTLLVSTQMLIDADAQTLAGCRGGLNLSKYTGRDVESAHFKPDFHAGAYLDYFFEDNFSVRVEAILSNRGNLKKPVNDSIERIYFHLRFIDFPVLVTNHVKNFEFSGGLTPSFLLKAENEINGDRNDLEMYYNPFGIAFVLGLQYEFAWGVNIGARAEYGLLNLVDENIVGETRANLLNFQFYMGFTILRKE